MSPKPSEADATQRARIPADVDAPDKVLYGLTARQAAIIAVAAAASYVMWQGLAGLLPRPVLLAAMLPVLAAGTVLAIGRRDGLSLDAWLLAAARQRRAPTRAAAAPENPTAPPAWSPAPPTAARGPVPATLRLPADAIDHDGVIALTDGTAATMVAVGTVNIALRSTDEQWALLAGYGRWLNSLTAPVQIVVSTQRADLTGHATRITDRAAALTDPALAAAADDHAAFLRDLAARRDPLTHTVTVVCTATGPAAAVEARRRGAHTATALSALGTSTWVLDGEAVLSALAAATDPYQHTGGGHRRALPDTPVRALPQVTP